MESHNSFKVGQIVKCPPDRGEVGYSGEIVRINEEVNFNYKGIPYRWIIVKKDNKTRHVWPSNRLGHY